MGNKDKTSQSIVDRDSDRLSRLKGMVDKLPHAPGVYLMRDQGSAVLYVGKAKDLRNRVRSYLGAGDGRIQIGFLMARVQTIESILTESEEQAFVLESDLIKQHKPRYNIRLKDDRAYLMVKIDRSAEWPRLEVVRRVQDDRALYFGPYPSGYQLRELLEVIKRVVPLRSCTDNIFNNRVRPCLEYQIKRCSGPCCIAVDRQEYNSWVTLAANILQGKVSGVVEELKALMNEAAEDLRFEVAAAHRDRIAVLERFASGQQVVVSAYGLQDVIYLYREGTLGVLCVLNLRNGRISGTDHYQFDELMGESAELLSQSIRQLYDNGRTIPDEIILPEELADQGQLTDWLKSKRNKGVELINPRRGSRVKVLALAKLNAQQQFSQRFEATDRYAELANEMQKLFNLRQAPRRIECIDISNLQGSDVVGALTSFFDGSPDKSRYRKYKIRNSSVMEGKPDDFNSIHEVVGRRLERGLAEGDLPDLLIIDGGLGQLNKALAAREECKMPLEIIALAKSRDLYSSSTSRISPKIRAANSARNNKSNKPERVFIEGKAESIPLAADSPLTYLLARIRDETHRFVITFHRSQRSKRSLSSILDKVGGLGAERKARLIKEYRTIAKLKAQSPEAIAKTGRMSKVLAAKVLENLGVVDPS